MKFTFDKKVLVFVWLTIMEMPDYMRNFYRNEMNAIETLLAGGDVSEMLNHHIKALAQESIYGVFWTGLETKKIRAIHELELLNWQRSTNESPTLH
jgi:hypothetical protein